MWVILDRQSHPTCQASDSLSSVKGVDHESEDGSADAVWSTLGDMAVAVHVYNCVSCGLCCCFGHRCLCFCVCVPCCSKRSEYLGLSFPSVHSANASVIPGVWDVTKFYQCYYNVSRTRINGKLESTQMKLSENISAYLGHFLQTPQVPESSQVLSEIVERILFAHLVGGLSRSQTLLFAGRS